jgi:DNA-binding response OmpR family regulator
MEETITDNQLVYVVDDDEVITSLVAINLTSQGYRVKQFHCGGELLESLNNDYPDLIILDVMMPGANGVEVAREIRRSSRVPIMMLSVYNDINTKATALNTGADAYLTKPFENEELLARVRPFCVVRCLPEMVTVAPSIVVGSFALTWKVAWLPSETDLSS